MSLKPTLALLIPAYNAEAYLRRLLESAANQTRAFDEIWVYDDCSTDNTATIAAGLGAGVVRGEVNHGCSHGKNALASNSTADWLHFHDADDELLPNFVELAQHWMEDSRFDVVLFAYQERDAATTEHICDRIFNPADVERDPRSYAIREQINPFCGLYRRTAFLRSGGYDEDPLVLYNEDVAMHIRLAFEGLSFTAETKVSIINHRRLDSMSASNRLECLRAQYHVMRKTAARNGADRYSADIAERLWNIIGGLTAELDWRTSDEAARLATKLAGCTAVPAGPAFKVLCRLSPHLALRVREWLIRSLKPRFREGYPGWRAPVSLF
jgi:glycosyltransferase involved in cell wall biosynthesis